MSAGLHEYHTISSNVGLNIHGQRWMAASASLCADWPPYPWIDAGENLRVAVEDTLMIL